jgi:hypothetical protein
MSGRVGDTVWDLIEEMHMRAGKSASGALSAVVATAFAVAAAVVGSAGGAAAASGGAPYLVGGTAYFNLADANCSIAPNGVVGCDIVPTGSIMQVTVAGLALPVPYVPAMIIDSAALPGHPQWSGAGDHTLKGGNPPVAYNPTQGTSSISYAGATCVASVRGGFDCLSMGHAIGVSGYNGSLYGN